MKGQAVYLSDRSEKQKYKIILCISAIVFCFLLWMQRNIIGNNAGIGFFFLEVMFTICMTVTCTAIIYYVFWDKCEKVLRHGYSQYYALLLIFFILAMLPLYTQNFVYGDDLWSFAEPFNGKITTGIALSRPFISFIRGIVQDLSFLSIRYYRLFYGVVIYLCGCIFFKYIAYYSRNCKLAFIFSICSMAGCVIVDCIAYAAVGPINIALAASAISFILYLKAKNYQRFKRGGLILVSGICLFTAFSFYQIGTPIVFLLYVIYETYNIEAKEKQRFVQAFLYLIYYACVAICYLFMTKVIQYLTNTPANQSSRGQVISSIEAVSEKIIWFFETVCPQALTRVVGFLFGNVLYVENNMFYTCTFKNEILGIVTICLLLIVIILGVALNAFKQKSAIYAIICVVAIPLSFYPFLILPESTFLSYYAIPLVLLFLWYVLIGGLNIINAIKKKTSEILETSNKISYFCGTIALVIVIQSNSYAQNSWVNYCRDSYEYLANTIYAELEADSNKNKIMVEGKLSPYVGDNAYVIYALKNVLFELGYNADDFSLAQCTNSYYLTSFEGGNIEYMEEVLGEETLTQLLNYYEYSDMYSVWYYNGTIQEQSEKEFLQECFYKTGQIMKVDQETIYINLNGFYSRNKF